MTFIALFGTSMGLGPAVSTNRTGSLSVLPQPLPDPYTLQKAEETYTFSSYQDYVPVRPLLAFLYVVQADLLAIVSHASISSMMHIPVQSSMKY